MQLGLLIVVCSGVSAYPSPSKRLTPAEAEVCRAKGGYESFGPKGTPFCQFRYGDGGKTCSGRVDCQGKCLFSLDGAVAKATPGDAVKGKCEAERWTSGCHASVEGGKLLADSICVD